MRAEPRSAALTARFRRSSGACKAGEKPGYPRFKGRGWFDSIGWPQHGNGCKWDSVPHPTVTRVYLMGMGHVRVHQHRAVKGTVKTITVKREGNGWYVILSCDDVPAEPLAPRAQSVGIDMGIASFLTTSDGKHVPNPRPLAATAERLTAGSAVARPQEAGQQPPPQGRPQGGRAAWQGPPHPADHAHKTALALVRDHDVIAHEELKIANMTRRPKPRPAEDGSYEPNGAAAKAGLNKSIYDAGWGCSSRYCAPRLRVGRTSDVEVNPRHTSQRCAECGHVAKGNRVTQAVFRCLKCGHEAHADVNAAINILRAGLVLQEAADAA